MSDKTTAGLLDLPNEILDLIVWYSPFKTRQQLSRVSRRFNDLCNATLYRSIRSEQGRQPWMLFDSKSPSTSVKLIDETSNRRVGLSRAPRSDFVGLMRSLRENSRLCGFVKEATILHVEPFENPIPQLYEFFQLVSESLHVLLWACPHNRILLPVMTSLSTLQLDYSFIYYGQRANSRRMEDMDFLQGLPSLQHLSLSDILPFERKELEDLLEWTPLLVSLRIIFPEKWEHQSLRMKSERYIPEEFAMALGSFTGNLRDVVFNDRLKLSCVSMPGRKCLPSLVGSFASLGGLRRLSFRLDWLTCLSEKCQVDPPHFRSLPDTLEELHLKISEEPAYTLADPGGSPDVEEHGQGLDTQLLSHTDPIPSAFDFVSLLVRHKVEVSSSLRKIALWRRKNWTNSHLMPLDDQLRFVKMKEDCSAAGVELEMSNFVWHEKMPWPYT